MVDDNRSIKTLKCIQLCKRTRDVDLEMMIGFEIQQFTMRFMEFLEIVFGSSHKTETKWFLFMRSLHYILIHFHCVNRYLYGNRVITAIQWRHASSFYIAIYKSKQLCDIECMMSFRVSWLEKGKMFATKSWQILWLIVNTEEINCNSCNMITIICQENALWDSFICLLNIA